MLKSGRARPCQEKLASDIPKFATWNNRRRRSASLCKNGHWTPCDKIRSDQGPRWGANPKTKQPRKKTTTTGGDGAVVGLRKARALVRTNQGVTRNDTQQEFVRHRAQRCSETLFIELPFQVRSTACASRCSWQPCSSRDAPGRAKKSLHLTFQSLQRGTIDGDAALPYAKTDIGPRATGSPHPHCAPGA